MEKFMWERPTGLVFTVVSAIIRNHQGCQRGQIGHHIVIHHKEAYSPRRRLRKRNPKGCLPAALRISSCLIVSRLEFIDQVKLQAIQIWILSPCRQPRRERSILQVAVQSAAYPPVKRRRSIASEQPVYVEAVFEHVGRSPQFAFIEL